MVTGKDIAKWVTGAIGTLATAGIMYAASTLYNVDKNIVGIEKHLEFIRQVLTDHSNAIKDHEQRIRALEMEGRGK